MKHVGISHIINSKQIIREIIRGIALETIEYKETNIDGASIKLIEVQKNETTIFYLESNFRRFSRFTDASLAFEFFRNYAGLFSLNEISVALKVYKKIHKKKYLLNSDRSAAFWNCYDQEVGVK